MAKFNFFNTDCAVLGYDITRRESFDNINSFWYPLSKENSNANLFYLIGNKADLYEDETVSENEARDYAKSNNMGFVLISCIKFIGIKEFLDDITEQLIKI